MVDLAVVVVKAGSTPFDLVQRAVDAIGRERTAGVVLNSVALGEMDPSGSSYYDQYYGARPEAVRNP
jgi:hypothetical protein